ncbi:hypothetical protein FHP29_18390 [Nocardioides albidus]|uniref:Uncharacterized protein n=1 Tax=Nocardioides albidus TaxID=1517589 RepID=A0A5C4VPK5_9ACTN|nr:hypothetical protein [Nocardioides albidus]TNM37747.1 hypothetical protein FHP29_18390 [Nocardioides albidus]
MEASQKRDPRNQRDDRAVLAACQAEVASARAQLEDARRRGARPDVDPLRQNLVAALEHYALTIERLGAPLPSRLCAELQLYRNLGHRT